jgi:hypothetical protein
VLLSLRTPNVFAVKYLIFTQLYINIGRANVNFIQALTAITSGMPAVNDALKQNLNLAAKAIVFTVPTAKT